jgi:hypothetical protein
MMAVSATNRGRALAAVCLAVALITLSQVAATPASAAGRGPLPAFQVLTLEGAALESAKMGPAGQWLLIYATPTSAASARLLNAMKQWESADLDARAVVVVGAALDRAAAFAQQHAADYPAVRWFADPDGAAWTALRLTGTPYILGIRDGQIVWSLAGVLNDPAALESVIRTWVEPKAP